MDREDFDEVVADFDNGDADKVELHDAYVARLSEIESTMRALSNEAERMFRKMERTEDFPTSHIASRACAYKAWANLLPKADFPMETSFASIVEDMSDEISGGSW